MTLNAMFPIGGAPNPAGAPGRRSKLCRRPLGTLALLVCAGSLALWAAAPVAPAAPPPAQAKSGAPVVTTIRVTVDVQDTSGNPVPNADVVLRQDSVYQGPQPRHPFDVELKTGDHGQVVVQGFQPGVVLVQVIADGYQTYGQAFIMKHANETVHVRLDPPQSQVSSF